MKIRSAREVAEEWGYTDYCGAVPPVNCGGTQPCAVCMVRKRDREIVEACRAEFNKWVDGGHLTHLNTALDKLLEEE